MTQYLKGFSTGIILMAVVAFSANHARELQCPKVSINMSGWVCSKVNTQHAAGLADDCIEFKREK